MKVWYGALLTMVGDCKAALAIVEEILETHPEHYLALGDYDYAFKWFNFEPHMHWLPWNVRGSKDSLFVKDPRFKALLRKMNLPDPAPYQYDPYLEL